LTGDTSGLSTLVEQSRDLHADAMRSTRGGLADLAAHRSADDLDCRRQFAATRRDLLRHAGGALAASGLAGALLAITSRPAFADQAQDVQILQTAASLENLAVATYDAALALPFMAGVPAVVKTFATTTRQQHADHAQAFNAAVAKLGGKPQTAPDPVVLGVVEQAKPNLKSPADVVDLAIKLETGAAETYSENTAAVTDLGARQAVASVMGVEAQHVAILNAVKALLAANLPQLLTLPPDISKLPAAAGSVGFPDSFLKTDQARPHDEGSVK
jgi:rubrerythrin